MNISLQTEETLTDFFDFVAGELSLSFSENGHPLVLIKQVGTLKIEHSNEETRIYYQERAHLFRALCLWKQKQRDSVYVYEETPQFQQIGPMIDLSRNAVMTVERLKHFILLTSKMGLNTLMLYMEDTYEIPEYPYFGHLRGRYTQSELRELDQYGQTLGVTLIPAIQTLAHLTNPLKWAFAREIRDTDDILLVDEPKTYAFIEAALTAISDCFTSKQVHIGMDEALQLGKGVYFEKHGNQDRFTIMSKHLQKVAALCQKLSIEPMMWSDMFFRIATPSGDYYDPQVNFPATVLQQLPDVKMVYWDYYHHDSESYQRMFQAHQKLSSNTAYAGGIWTWNGLAPNYGKTFATMEKAIAAAKKAGIQEVYATLWGDDGAETPMISSLLGLQLFSEAQFTEKPSMTQIQEKFADLHGLKAADFLLLNQFDQTVGVEENNPRGANPSKLLLYQDLLYGVYEADLEPLALTSHFEQLAQQLALVQTTPDTKTMFAFYQQLAQTLAIKATLSPKIYRAYQHQNREKLTQLLADITNYSHQIHHLYERHRQLWFEWNRPFGFEIIDLRYGALMKRAEMAHWRLKAYINHELDTLPELEQPRLPVDESHKESPLIGRNLFHGIYSASKISDV